jgi:hypothetical protein
MLLFLHAAVRALEGRKNRRGTPNMPKRMAQEGRKPKPEDAIAQSPLKAQLDLAVDGGAPPASLRSRPEEHEPDHAKDQDREPRGYRQEREHRRARFGLTGLGWGFDDLAMSLRCHMDLFE